MLLGVAVEFLLALRRAELICHGESVDAIGSGSKTLHRSIRVFERTTPSINAGCNLGLDADLIRVSLTFEDERPAERSLLLDKISPAWSRSLSGHKALGWCVAYRHAYRIFICFLNHGHVRAPSW
jgi:hypothetical protein